MRLENYKRGGASNLWEYIWKILGTVRL